MMADSRIIQLPLSSEQAMRFADILEAQNNQEKSAIFAVITDSYVPIAGRGVLRLQLKLVSWKTAQKVVKLLRADSAPDADP
jgi:hypothetical protein